MQVICHTPEIRVLDAALDEAAIRALEVEIAGQLPTARAEGNTKHDDTGLSFELRVAACPAARRLRDLAQGLLGLGNDLGETLRYRRYLPGESHPAHCDHYQVGGTALVATALFHLADTRAGGATRFLEARPVPVEVAPKRGRLVMWMNHGPDGAPDACSIHDAAPVEAGEKVTLTQFLYQPPAVLPA